METIWEESSFGTDSSFVDESIDVVEQSVEKLHPPTMKTNHRSILLNTPKNSSKSDTIDLTMGIKKTTKKTKFKFEIEDDSLDDVESIFSEMDKEQKIKTLNSITPVERSMSYSEKDEKSDIENQ